MPGNVDDLAATLEAHPQAIIVAGATDVGLWITKHLRDISPAIFIGHLMKEITVDAGGIRIGAGVSYSEFLPVARQYLPEAEAYLLRIGGWQVRNAGTIGGNIANGSPIGEMPPLLIALRAQIVLRKGTERRTLPLEDFFIAYGKQDRQPGEFVETILIPHREGARVAAYKVSKRAHADISAVSAGFAVRESEGRIVDARIAFGGMAGTPRRAPAAEAALIGRPFAKESFEDAATAVQDDFAPLTDWRGSSDYRRIVAGNMFRRFWLEQSQTVEPIRIDRALGA